MEGGGEVEEDLGVGADAVFDGEGVAAAHADDDGDAVGTAGVKDDAVAAAEPFLGHGEFAEFVFAEGVDAGLVEDDLGREGEDAGEDGFELGKELVVAGIVGQGDVDLALLLAEREVVGPVHGEGEHVGVVLIDGGGAIALMDIEIDDGDAADEAERAEMLNGDGDVVEDAEACALMGEGVMGATGEIAAEAVLHGIEGRGDGATDGSEGAVDERFGPGKADAADGLLREGAAKEGIEVVGRVDAGELLPGSEGGALKAEVAGWGEEVAHQPVLFHGELVPVGQGQMVVVAVMKARLHGFVDSTMAARGVFGQPGLRAMGPAGRGRLMRAYASSGSSAGTSGSFQAMMAWGRVAAVKMMALETTCQSVGSEGIQSIGASFLDVARLV